MPELREGEVLGGRFEIVGALGRGGMATVYLARDRVRGERVALKVLHEHLARDPAMRERLRRELLAAARLRHPGALTAHELHELDGVLALSLPFHPGETLADLVARDGPLEPEAVRRLGARLAEVLAEAHEAGVLHRDLTPRNVMIGARGEPALTDFGLARLRDGGSTRGTGMLGTPGYAAPEVYDGVRADPRSDLYALGAVLYLAATGKNAFEAESPMQALRRQLDGTHRPLAEARPELPEDLRQTIEALLQPDPERRPQGARDLAEALKARRAPETPEASPATLAAEPAVADPARVVALPAGALEARLPEGGWTVRVRGRGGEDRRHERRARAAWRRARRRTRLDRETWQADPGRAVGDLLGVGGQFLGELIGGEDPGPERFVADAVAQEAGLPEGALRISPVLAERQFRLVHGVEQGVAERLAAAGHGAGFKAEAVEIARSEGPRARAMGAVIPALVLIGVAVAVSSSASWILLAIAVGIALKAMLGLSAGPEALPVAYPTALGPLLALGTTATAQAAPVAPAQPAAVQPAAVPAAPPTRGGQALARTEAALASLRAAIEAQRAELPDEALRDLERSLGELSEEAAGLAAELDALEAERLDLERQDPEGALAAAQARLARLDTLARGGEPVDPGERARLEAESAALREACATLEALEGRFTARLARLLELGAAAGRARRQLLEEPEPARSVERLGETLRQQAAAAVRARREMA